MAETHWLDDIINQHQSETMPLGGTPPKTGSFPPSSLYDIRAELAKNAAANPAVGVKPSAANLIFKGMQENPEGKAFPLFNVDMPSHPLNGSTISEVTARKEGFLPNILESSAATNAESEVGSNFKIQALMNALKGKMGTFAAGAVFPPQLSDMANIVYNEAHPSKPGA